MTFSIKKILRPFLNLARCKISDLKRKYFHQFFPIKPIVINFNANDICNSKCVMCNIWKQKRDKEISADELESILRDKLYSEVRHVGVTGGEPTLRKDLCDLYDTICRTLPSLTGVSIITNAIRDKTVIDQLNEIKKVCDKHRISFSVMVSLDGFGDTHDLMRGRKGNFESAINVIKSVKEMTGVPLSVGCTITRENVWEVDTLLDYLRENQIYGRFRVAEFIDRLYNNELKSNIRNFDQEELYHLACFFQKLILTFEDNEEYQRTYKSIINMLLGGKRQIGCPYQTKGIVLDARGDLQYCAPKSKKIGNSLSQSSAEIYSHNLEERRNILSDHCNDCIHDYHAEITFPEKLRAYQEIFWHEMLTIKRIGLAKLFQPILTWHRLKKREKSVLIVGWYGTETVGDKAILGGIIDDYTKNSHHYKLVIASIYPFVTAKTVKELGIDARIIPFYSSKLIHHAGMASEIVMGGGPLMDMEALAIPLWAVELARMTSKKSVIYGCGIGPIRNDKYRSVVTKIIKKADHVFLRDAQSVQLAQELSGRDDIEYSGDPAKPYIKKAISSTGNGQKPIINCFIREWTQEYQGNLSDVDFDRVKNEFEFKLSEVIKRLARELNVTPNFYPMHTFVVGNDDRDFFRRYTKTFFKDQEFNMYEKNASVNGVIESMKSARYNLCMRFHSVLFAHTLGANFFAIDYTNGGKIAGYLQDEEASSHMMSLQEISGQSIDISCDRIRNRLLENEEV